MLHYLVRNCSVALVFLLPLAASPAMLIHRYSFTSNANDSVGTPERLTWLRREPPAPPSDHTGWLLQAQTNSLNAGLRTNWVTLPGSDSTSQITLPIGLDTGAVFFRLIYP
jgi:hypothetical protein